MRSKRLVFFVVLLLLIGAALPAAGAQGKTLYWQRWDSDITVLENGDLRIVETHEVNFTSGEFRFGMLGIDQERLESISDVSVREGDTVYEVSGSQTPGTFFIRGRGYGATFEITYFLLDPPVSRETRTITIAYTVKGATRYYEGGDQVYWEAVGALGWPIDSATVTLRLPAAAAPRPGVDPVVCYGLACQISVDGSTITYRLTERSKGTTPLEIRAQFPHGVITGEAPAWQREYDRQRHYDEVIKPALNLLFGVLGLALIAGGPLIVLLLWRLHGHDPDPGAMPEYLTEPPSDLPPGIVGTLVDEQADLQDITATLIDLARRGYLTIEQTSSWGRFVFRRTDKPGADLHNYESFLLRQIFGFDKTERKLDDLKASFYTAIPHLQDRLYGAVVQDGFFTAEPDDVRAFWRSVGTVIVVAAVIALIGIPLLFRGIAETWVLVPVGLGITGLLVALAGRWMPAKTRKGAEQAALWAAFRSYIKQIKQYNTDIETATDQFEKYLPYAVAFGLDKTWTHTFAQVPSTPAPAWYIPFAPYRQRSSAAVGRTVTDLGRPASSGAASSAARASSSAGPDLSDQLARPTQSAAQALSDGLASSLSDMSSGLASLLNSAASTFTSRPQPTRSYTSGSWNWGTGSSSRSGWGSSRSSSSWSSSRSSSRSSWSGGGSRGGGSSGRRSGGFG
ncbi:MAG: DUF2207 domain-containing protein [Anaerolineae bacterium]|nr:DUF2207 domain-containing protein [Anaerolineae bacterium]